MKNIHILSTGKPSRLYLNTQEYIFENEYSLSTDECQNKHIYITSDEEIKEGDWCIDTKRNIIFQSKKTEIGTSKKIPIIICTYEGCYIKEDCKKIILTTDQDLIKDGVQSIDDEFLEWFVNNPSCEEVETERFYSMSQSTYSGIEYEIIIPKEEPKLSNICIKCGVDLYATEGRFECQKHPKECKGIYLSEETLLTHAAEQKQHIIDMMKSDEELGLYEEPKQETLEDASWKYNPLKKLDGEFLRHAFKEGAKWQQERSYSEEDMIEASKYGYNFHKTTQFQNQEFEDSCIRNTQQWLTQFKKK